MSELKQRLLLFELARLGYTAAAYDPESDRVRVQPDKSKPILIDDSGDVFYIPEERDFARNTVKPLADYVNEVLFAWERNQPIPVGDLPEFRVMAEYNSIVLAARDDTAQGYGFHYVTWEYNSERTGLNQGRYTEDLATAKQDFAIRSGLVSKDRLLSPEQATVVRLAVAYRLDHDYNMLKAADDAITEAARKLEKGYPGPLIKDYLTPQQIAEQEESQDMELEL
jgi:hypothetical protein